jgi:hypothetical protein
MLIRHAKEDQYRITAKAELSWLKGNAKPYFSLTASGVDRDCEFGGCCHDEILKHWPDLAPLVNLHLSDIDGIPMHALENGFFHLGGTHWERPKFDVAARHFRITEDAARKLVADFFGDSFSITAGFLSTGAANQAQAKLATWVEAQKPRWLAEANAAIEQFGLTRPDKPKGT